MNALTVNPGAQRPTQSSAKLRRLAKSLTSVLFSERIALVVTVAGGSASFFAAVADRPTACAAITAAMLPWFMSLLNAKGGVL
jgi:hypothetical protein